MTFQPSIRLRAAALLAGFSLALSSCFISPGKFTSELIILENDQFTFTYEGEVYFLALSDWVKMQQDRGRPEFQSYCYGPTKDGSEPKYIRDEYDEAAEEAAEAAEEAAGAAVDAAADEAVNVDISVPADEPMYSSQRRECTAEEEAEQRAEWEEAQQMRMERDKRQAEQISKLIGGVDPTDPNAEAELARILERQKGFDRVVSKGNGLFDISYSISGTLSHDFMFPMMEDFPTINPFVQLFLRDGGLVRVNAIGFAPQSVTNPMATIMAGATGFGSRGSDEFEAMADVPPVEGTFTIVTTGDIRANNTDEGPATDGNRKRLTWKIDNRSKATPTALIALPR